MKDKFNMVGTKVNEFSLPNNDGTEVAISSFFAQKNVVIVLLTDLHWPYCRAHVKSLSEDIEKFQALDTELYPILADTQAHAIGMWKAFAKRKFPIYYDDDESIVKKVLNQEWKIFKLGRMPALLIVDKNGMIRYAHYGDSMSDIPKNEEILQFIQNMQ